MGIGPHHVPPAAESPDLHLDQPTPEECMLIWSNTSASWKDALTVLLYMTESQFLTTVPLAKDGGMSTWVLVDKNLPPNCRAILCSCETFRKRCLTSDERGNVEEGLVHGVASVFCPKEFRGRGYGSRHIRELAEKLRTWQLDHGKSVGSVLYSDIGKEYYARLGWLPCAMNVHVVFPPIKMGTPSQAAEALGESALEAVCRRDESTIRQAMAAPSQSRRRVVILPDLDHMLWNIRKEDFATRQFFGKVAGSKGAICGRPGRQVWAIWARRYYHHPDHLDEKVEQGQNVLYILRLVVEGDDSANKPREDVPSPANDAQREQGEALRAVIQAAQTEAAEWRLDCVKLWNPSPLVTRLLGETGLDTTWVEREEESIASGLWYETAGSAGDEAPAWINNERYAWC